MSLFNFDQTSETLRFSGSDDINLDSSTSKSGSKTNPEIDIFVHYSGFMSRYVYNQMSETLRFS